MYLCNRCSEVIYFRDLSSVFWYRKNREECEICGRYGAEKERLRYYPLRVIRIEKVVDGVILGEELVFAC